MMLRRRPESGAASSSLGRLAFRPKSRDTGVAERDRDPRSGVAHLRDAVLPVVLAGAAHHEEIAVTDVVADRAATRARPQPERPPRPDADDGDVELRQFRTAQVAVPGDRVVA